MWYLQLFAIVFILETSNAQFFNSAANNAQTVACLVTGNKLFSHGNFIRDLKADELPQINKYTEEIVEFQKKLSEAFAPINFLANSTAMPIMPTRPLLPSFCTSNETTLYILGSCTLQNHKIYVNGNFARELNEEEKVKLNEFANRLSGNQYDSIPNLASNTTESVLDTSTTTTTLPPPQQKIVLDFCQEF